MYLGGCLETRDVIHNSTVSLAQLAVGGPHPVRDAARKLFLNLLLFLQAHLGAGLAQAV
jgi:hypothetical protein